MPSPEKFKETLAQFAVDESTVREINKGYENVVSKTNKKIKSAYMKQALEVMNERLPKASAGEGFSETREFLIGTPQAEHKLKSTPKDKTFSASSFYY